MHIKQFQVDAFTPHLFGGNPAAVCMLDTWLPDATMQAIAMENNLSETAFIVPSASHRREYAIRWFTPNKEVDLCGHATLASAFVIFSHYDTGAQQLMFHSRSGELPVTRSGSLLTLNFPASAPGTCSPPQALLDGIGLAPNECLAAEDYMLVFNNEEDVLTIQPDMAQLAKLDRRGVIITAPGRHCDIVSRFFAPKFGIPEDPVTGSAHCMLTPYWSQKLGKPALTAQQLSARRGQLQCQLKANRVLISGECVLFSISQLELPGS